MLHPLDLRDISRNSTCLGTVARWWRRFHRVDMKLSDFEHVFMDKFDTVRDRYSVVTHHDVQQCKVRQQSKEQRSVLSIFGHTACTQGRIQGNPNPVISSGK